MASEVFEFGRPRQPQDAAVAASASELEARKPATARDRDVVEMTMVNQASLKTWAKSLSLLSRIAPTVMIDLSEGGAVRHHPKPHAKFKRAQSSMSQRLRSWHTQERARGDTKCDQTTCGPLDARPPRPAQISFRGINSATTAFIKFDICESAFEFGSFKVHEPASAKHHQCVVDAKSLQLLFRSLKLMKSLRLSFSFAPGTRMGLDSTVRLHDGNTRIIAAHALPCAGLCLRLQLVCIPHAELSAAAN